MNCEHLFLKLMPRCVDIKITDLSCLKKLLSSYIQYKSEVSNLKECIRVKSSGRVIGSQSEGRGFDPRPMLDGALSDYLPRSRCSK